MARLSVMATVELQFLGDYSVRRNGDVVALPPSKKTRALLAYLALRRRSHRREHLCELLWEIPDDPRGALRWSLSKLRRLVDDDKKRRLIADRTHVTLNADDVDIDVIQLRSLVANELGSASLEKLTDAAARFSGNFLEGLEFSSFHDFHGWCVAEREQSLRDRAALLQELVRRLQATPDRALGYARQHVGLSPYDEQARASLVRLLHSARQPTEAEEQYQLGLRMLREADIAPTGALATARVAPRVNHSSRPGRAEVGGPKRRDVPACPPLLGRDAELSRIQDIVLRSTERSEARLLAVSGAPGIGKTRLMEAVFDLADERGAFIVRATAFESDIVRPFSVWIDALRTLNQHPMAELFSEGAEVPNRERLFGRLSELVAERSVDRPVVLLFDDVHWCDESSAAALHYVLRMNRQRAVLAVVTARDGELRDNTAMQTALRGLRRDGRLDELTLGPLPAEALSALIVQHVPGADHERWRAECAGNPLLAIELARAERDGSGRGSIPELVRERLSRVSASHAEVLRWAAVLHPRIEVSWLVQATQQNAADVGEALEVGERQGLLRLEDQKMTFSHALIADAVYRDVSLLRRQVMHRRVACLLENDPDLDRARSAELAHHACQSRDAALAARAMVSVGRMCIRFFANADAQSVARQGLQCAAALPEVERVCRELELLDILQCAGPLEDPDASVARYTVLAEKALDHGAMVHARLGYHMASHVRWSQGKWSKAREHSLQAERVARGAESNEQIIGMAETAMCLVMLERDLAHADAMLNEASALAERRRFSHHAIQGGLGLLRLREDRLSEAESFLQQSRTFCRSAGHRLCEFIALEYLVLVDLQRGEWHQARARSDVLLALGDRIREGSEAPFARALLGLCTYAIDDASEVLEAALEELRLVDAEYRLACVLTRASLVDVERGRMPCAQARAEEALACARILARPTEMLLAHAVRACGLASGDSKQARRHAESANSLKPCAAVWAVKIADRLEREYGERAFGAHVASAANIA